MDRPEDLHNLYADFGVAVEKAQVLELEAGNVVLSLVMLFVDTDKITDEERDVYKQLLDDVDRKTLGNLLRKIKSIVKFDDSSEKVIDIALKKRNYLVHGFFKTHNFAIFQESGRVVMREELTEIANYLELAHQQVLAISKLLEKVSGKEGQAEQTARKLQEQGRSVKI